MTFRGGGFPKAGLPGGASFFLISAECRHPLVLSVPTSSLPVREGCSGEGGEVARMGGSVIIGGGSNKGWAPQSGLDKDSLPS